MSKIIFNRRLCRQKEFYGNLTVVDNNIKRFDFVRFHEKTTRGVCECWWVMEGRERGGSGH